MGGKNKKKHRQSYAQKQPKAQSHHYEYERASQEDLQIECLEISELIHKRHQALKESQADHVYVLSRKWLTDWKEYVGYDRLTEENPKKWKNVGKRHPGKINANLIASNKDYFTIPEELDKYAYLNTVIKADMDKDDDYLAVTPQIWEALSNRYDSFEIMRPVRKFKSGNIFYDSELLQCDVIFVDLNYPDLHEQLKATKHRLQLSQIVFSQKMQLSNIWELEHLQQFLKEYSLVVHKSDEVKIWKGQAFLSTKQLQEQIKQSITSQSYELSAFVVEGDQYDDLDIDQYVKSTYTLIVEIGKPVFKRVVPFQEIFGFCEECIKKKDLLFHCTCNQMHYCSKQCEISDKNFHFKICTATFDSDDDEPYKKKSIKEEPMSGLVNIGNTCYMASSIQCLLSLERLRTFFTCNHYQKQIDEEESKATKAMFLHKWSKMCKQMVEAKNDYEPWSIKAQINYFMPPFKGFKQNDANDFLINFINTLNDFLKKEGGNIYHSFFIENCLGKFNSLVRCPTCTIEIHNEEIYSQITLPIKSKTKETAYNAVVIESPVLIRKGKAHIREQWGPMYAELAIDKCLTLAGREAESAIQLNFELQPEVAIRKSKREVLYYPGVNVSKSETVIMATFISKSIIYNNEMKSPYGYAYPIVFIPEIDTMGTIWIKIAKLFANQEQKEALTDIQSKYFESIETLIKQNSKNKEEITSENQKDTENEEDIEKEKEKEEEQENKLVDIANQELTEYLKKLGIKVFLHDKNKRHNICRFCQKKCKGCELPIKIDLSVEEMFDKKSGEVELEIHFESKLNIEVEKFDHIKSGDCTLQDCFQLFREPEQLDQENAWYCEICDEMKLAHKQMNIKSFPKYLILHLNRFKNEDGKKVKNSEPIQYQEIQLFGDKQYRLKGVIVHEGSMQGGHYWAICYRQGKYHVFNDHKVTQIKAVSNKNAYILFYEENK